MTQALFGRVITAMVTPFDEAGQVDFAVAEKLAVHLVESGSDALVVCGTTGESPTLTWQEEHELFRVIHQAITPKGKVIAGTGSNSTQEAIAATEKAAQLGLAGSLQVVPYYNKPPQAGLYQHFAAIAQACPDFPIMLYNIPSRTGRALEVETIVKLAQIGNIIAIKEATGDLDQASQLRQQLPASFGIYSGDDSLTLPLLAIGAQGVVSVASHLVCPELQGMIQFFEAGNVKRAREIHLQLLPLFKALFCSTNPIPIKAALNLQGWQVGGLRPPLNELPPELMPHLKETLLDLDLL